MGLHEKYDDHVRKTKLDRVVDDTKLKEAELQATRLAAELDLLKSRATDDQRGSGVTLDAITGNPYDTIRRLEREISELKEKIAVLQAQLHSEQERNRIMNVELQNARTEGAAVESTLEGENAALLRESDAKIQIATKDKEIEMKALKTELAAKVGDLEWQLKKAKDVMKAAGRGEDLNLLEDAEKRAEALRLEQAQNLKEMKADYQESADAIRDQNTVRIGTLSDETAELRKTLSKLNKSHSDEAMRWKRERDELVVQYEDWLREARKEKDEAESKKTLALKKQFKKMEMDSKEIDDLRARCRKLELSLQDEIEGRKADFNNMTVKHKKELEEVNKRLRASQSVVKVLEDKHQRQLSKFVNDLKKSSQDLEDDRKEGILAGEGFVSDLKSHISMLEKELSLQDVKLKDLTDQLEMANQRSKSQEEEHEKEKGRRNQSSKRTEGILNDRIEALEGENKMLSQNIAKLEGRLRRVTVERSTAEDDKSKADTQIRLLESSLANVRKEKDTVVDDLKMQHKTHLATQLRDAELEMIAKDLGNQQMLKDLRFERDVLKKHVDGDAIDVATEFEKRVEQLREDRAKQRGIEGDKHREIVKNQKESYDSRIAEL